MGSLPREDARRGEGLAGDVFEAFPHGIAVFDPEGVLLIANPTAERLLGLTSGHRTGSVRCCDLFGCRSGRPPMGDACLVDLAIRRGVDLPELRVDLSGDPPRSVWVAVALLNPEGSRVVAEVRMAQPHDRRRRTEPHWTADPEIRIITLGKARVESREGPIGGAWLDQRPGQLLKYLVCERNRVVTMEEIAEALWPTGGLRGLGSVRHFVHELRDRLEPGRRKRTPSSFVVHTQRGYTLNRNRVWIDADEFEKAFTQGNRAFGDGDLATTTRRLEQAVELYGGDLFAEDPYSLWAMPERERLHEAMVGALRMLVGLKLHAGRPEAAHGHLLRIAELEPVDLMMQRELIRNCLRLGRRSEAMRRYQALRTRMRQEFHEELDFDLAELSQETDAQLRLI